MSTSVSMSGGRRAGAALALFVITTLGCVAPQSFPWKADEPFPYGLTLALEDEGWGREEVTRRLGSPDAIRKSGRIAIWVEPRQMELDFMGGVYAVENHYLFIEYDEHGQVTYHQILVNDGCLPSGECLENALCPRGGTCTRVTPHPLSAAIAEWKAFASDHLLLYAAPADDLRAKSFETPPNRCRLFVFLEDHNHMRPGGPYVKIGHGPTSQKVAIGHGGFLTWDAASGIEQVRISWSDSWKTFNNRKTVEVPCEAGEPVFLEVEMHRTGRWTHEVDLEARSVERSAGESTVKDLHLILE